MRAGGSAHSRGLESAKTAAARSSNSSAESQAWSFARATRATNGWLSIPIESAPAARAATSVVPEPTNGSRTLSRSPCGWLLTILSTHAAENPAEYLNQRWTGNVIFGVKTEELANVPRGSEAKSRGWVGATDMAIDHTFPLGSPRDSRQRLLSHCHSANALQTPYPAQISACAGRLRMLPC